jgi:hypothetical protein
MPHEVTISRIHKPRLIGVGSLSRLGALLTHAVVTWSPRIDCFRLGSFVAKIMLLSHEKPDDLLLA